MKVTPREMELYRMVELLNDTCNLLAKKIRRQNVEIRRLRRLVADSGAELIEKKRVN